MYTTTYTFPIILQALIAEKHKCKKQLIKKKQVQHNML
jgi:hypothetical protein